MLATGRPLSELRKSLTLFPQLKKNLLVARKLPLETIPGFAEGLAQIEAGMGRGRVLVRYSGTEAKIRLLAEARDRESAGSTLAALEALVRKHLDVVG